MTKHDVSVTCNVTHLPHPPPFHARFGQCYISDVINLYCSVNGRPQGNGQHGRASHRNGCFCTGMGCLGSVRCSKVSVTDSVLSQIKPIRSYVFQIFASDSGTKNRSWTSLTYHTSYMSLLTHFPVLIKLGIERSIQNWIWRGVFELASLLRIWTQSLHLGLYVGQSKSSRNSSDWKSATIDSIWSKNDHRGVGTRRWHLSRINSCDFAQRFEDETC